MRGMSSNVRIQGLLVAVVISGVGDLLFDLYIAWTLAVQYDTIMAAAGLIGASLLFRAILALFLGTVVDRYSKRRLLVASNAGSVVVLATFMVVGDYAISSVGFAVALVLVNDVFNELFSRAYIVSASMLSLEKEFIRFQARATVGLRVVATVGMVLAGWLISVLSGQQVIAVDLVSFCLCGVVCFFVAPSVSVSDGAVRHLPAPFADLKLMLRRIFRDRYLLSFTTLMLVLNLAYGFVPQLFPLILAREESSSFDLGWLRAGIAIGEICGLLVMERLAAHVRGLFVISMVGCGVTVAVAGLDISLIAGAVLLALYGAFDALSQPLFSHTVMMIDSSERGRVLGGVDAIILLTPTLGILVGSRLAEYGTWCAGLFVSLVFVAGLVLMFSLPGIQSVGSVVEKEKK